MYSWSKIPEEHRPEIISDISNDDKLYTLIVQDWNFNKIKRKDSSRDDARAAATLAAVDGALRGGTAGPAAAAAIYAVDVAWEGSYWQKGIFKNIIDKNIPCTLMHKVKNKWCPEIDTIVCFMTGDTLDVFLIHPKDLTIWDPSEANL